MPLKGKHIFIVEDQATNLAVMLTILQQAGAKTSFDRWGTNTTNQLLNQDPVDLILMDLMLPRGKSGYDVYDELRKQPSLASIPAVIVSAVDSGESIAKARDKGFAGYITKPLDIRSFSKMLAAIMNGREIWADSADAFA